MPPLNPEKLKEEAKKDAESMALLLLVSLEQRSNPEDVVWHADVNRFFFHGRSVSPELIRNYLERIETRLGRRLLKLTNDLKDGHISAVQWHREFEKTIRSSQILAASFALGGIGAAVGNQFVLDRIDSELEFAGKFQTEITKGKAGSPARIAARAKSYLAASRITFAQVEQDAREIVGIQTECKRIRRASESCSGCIYWAKKGWISIQLQPKIGTLQCGRYCKCFLIYR